MGDGETEDAVVVDTIDDAGDPVDVVIPMSVELDKPRGDPVESDDDDVSKEGEAVVEAMDAVVEEMEEDVDKLEAAVEDELVVSDESEELLKIEVAGRLDSDVVTELESENDCAEVCEVLELGRDVKEGAGELVVTYCDELVCNTAVVEGEDRDSTDDMLEEVVELIAAEGDADFWTEVDVWVLVPELVPRIQTVPDLSQPFLHVITTPLTEVHVAAWASKQTPQKSGVTK